MTSHWLSIGQPAGYPLQEHLLVVSCQRVPVPTGLDDPTVIFVGGADADEVRTPGEAASPSEYLAAMYPVQDRDEMERIIGTIDYRPSPRSHPAAARRSHPLP